MIILAWQSLNLYSEDLSQIQMLFLTIRARGCYLILAKVAAAFTYYFPLSKEIIMYEGIDGTG